MAMKGRPLHQFDGASYQARFDALAESGQNVHGEADFVCSFSPATVLDAGCGTGRVAIELARRGIEVVGVDRDGSMLAEARRRAPALSWVEADLVDLDLDRRFDVVLMAGNVPLFTPADRRDRMVRACAAHVAPGGCLVSGFGLGQGYDLGDYDLSCRDSGLEPAGRWSSWHLDGFGADADYAVSAHLRASSPQ